MDKVNLYTYTTVRGPGKKNGSYIYILEAMTSQGIRTREGSGALEGESENQAHLHMLIDAMERMTRACEITLYTDSTYLQRAVEEWLPVWAENGWMNARKKPIANLEEWQNVAELLGLHRIVFQVGERHSYSDWIRYEGEKIEKERKKCGSSLENLAVQKKSTNLQSI